MTDFGTVNFFKDRAVQDDPYPYYEWLREQGPVWQEPKYGIYLVSGYVLSHPEEVETYLRGRQRLADDVRRENEARFNPTGVRDRLLARRRQG